MGRSTLGVEHARLRTRDIAPLPLPVLTWIDLAPIYLIGMVLLVFMLAATYLGFRMRVRLENQSEDDVSRKWRADYDGYIVTAVLGLLALLLGFTFSLAIGRYEERRQLVVAEANAIGRAYLRAQLLDAPHRQRLAQLLVAFTDEEIALGTVSYRPAAQRLLVQDDLAITNLWAATAAAVDVTKSSPVAMNLIQAVNDVIDQNAARRAVRSARIPTEVFAILFVYLVGTAAVLGYVLAFGHGRFAAAFLLVLLCISLLLIIDIDRPASGGIREPQEAMQQVRFMMRSQPAQVYDRWRTDALRR